MEHIKDTSKLYDLRFIKLIFNCYMRNSSLKQKLLFMRAVIRRVRGKRLKEIAISLTYRCQFECVHCCMSLFEKTKKKELSVSQIKKIIDNTKNDFNIIYFTGGEPLLRKKDIIELIEYVSSKGLSTEIDSNGIGLDYEMAKKLKKARLNHINISLDAASEKEHDRLRKFKCSYAAVMDAMDNCRKAGLPFLVSTYVTKARLANGEVAGVIKIAREKGAVGVRVEDPKLAGKWLKRKDMMLDKHSRILFRKLLRSGFVFNECKSNISPYPLCFTLSKSYLYISPYGEVQPCPLVPISFGNVKKRNVMEIIKDMWEHEMFSNLSERTCLINNPGFRKKYLKLGTKTKLPIEVGI